MESLQKKTRVTRYNCMLVKEETHLYVVPKRMTSPTDIQEYLERVMQLSQKTEEYFVVIYLDTKMTAIGYHIVAKGSLTSAIVHPREVFKGALLANARGIIAAHNHPSGCVEPSDNDINTTKRLQEAGNILGIDLMDHIIIGDKRYYSFKEESVYLDV